jgi:transcriptional regulator with XRE-family HTH domain
MSDIRQHDHDELARLGQTVRQLREQRNISASDFANASGITLRRVTRIEAGKVDPRYDELLALARGLSIKPSELFIQAQQL